MRATLSQPKARLSRLLVVTLVALAVVWGFAGCQPANQGAATEPAGAATPPAASATPTLPESSGAGSPGVYDDRVVFGQSAAFSGPASQLGLGMKLGIGAAFAEANRNGGVHGRQLELTSRGRYLRAGVGDSQHDGAHR